MSYIFNHERRRLITLVLTIWHVRPVALGGAAAAFSAVPYHGQGRTLLLLRRFSAELHLFEQTVRGEERGVVVAGTFTGDVRRTGQFVSLLEVRVQLAD